MNTEFLLGWLKSPVSAAKAFKQASAAELFEEYLKRINHFSKSSIGPMTAFQREPGAQLWICHTSSTAKTLSSEALAEKIEKLRDSGVRRLVIGIGGPDGFTAALIEKLRPDFQWSFGPMTLPHELAAIVAAEQIYRAWTILLNLPYHKGH